MCQDAAAGEKEQGCKGAEEQGSVERKAETANVGANLCVRPGAREKEQGCRGAVQRRA